MKLFHALAGAVVGTTVGAFIVVARRGNGGGAPVRGMARSLPFIENLHPTIQDRAKQTLQNAANGGVDLVITQGFRSSDEQARLYAQGRTAPGPVVTNAPPGSSWHEFGLAFDVAVLTPSDGISYPNNEALWQRIGTFGKAAGLDWGGDFTTIKDRPHFERHPGLTLSMARAGSRPIA